MATQASLDVDSTQTPCLSGRPLRGPTLEDGGPWCLDCGNSLDWDFVACDPGLHHVCPNCTLPCDCPFTAESSSEASPSTPSIKVDASAFVDSRGVVDWDWDRLPHPSVLDWEDFYDQLDQIIPDGPCNDFGRAEKGVRYDTCHTCLAIISDDSVGRCPSGRHPYHFPGCDKPICSSVGPCGWAASESPSIPLYTQAQELKEEEVIQEELASLEEPSPPPLPDSCGVCPPLVCQWLGLATIDHWPYSFHLAPDCHFSH